MREEWVLSLDLMIPERVGGRPLALIGSGDLHKLIDAARPERGPASKIDPPDDEEHLLYMFNTVLRGTISTAVAIDALGKKDQQKLVRAKNIIDQVTQPLQIPFKGTTSALDVLCLASPIEGRGKKRDTALVSFYDDIFGLFYLLFGHSPAETPEGPTHRFVCALSLILTSRLESAFDPDRIKRDVERLWAHPGKLRTSLKVVIESGGDIQAVVGRSELAAARARADLDAVLVSAGQRVRE